MGATRIRRMSMAGLGISLAVMLITLCGCAAASTPPVLNTNLSTTATTSNGMLTANADGSVSGTLDVSESYAGCSATSTCEWNLEAIGIAATSGTDPTCPSSTTVQSWQSPTYTSTGNFQIPLSIHPSTTGNGAICLYVNMTTTAGTFQGLVNSFPYTLPALEGSATISVVPSGTTFGGTLTLTESSCTSSLCAWSSELALVSGTTCPNASTQSSPDPRAGWQYQSAPNGSAAPLSLSWTYGGELPTYTRAGTVTACLYIGPVDGPATSLIGSQSYSYIAPLSSATARTAVIAAVKRKLHVSPRVICRQHNSSLAVCTVHAENSRYRWNGTATVTEPMWAKKLTVSPKLIRKRA